VRDSAPRPTRIDSQKAEVKPDLAVEVLSPGQNETTPADKLADYASILVEEVWFADQEAKAIRVLAREGDGYRLAGEFGPGTRPISRVLPGLELAVDGIFS
jgi:Uma2 family endonuclease